MLKIIMLAMIFTLAACSDNSNKSSVKKSGVSSSTSDSSLLTGSSNFSFIADDQLRACLDNSGMTVGSVHTLVCAGKGVQSLSGLGRLPELKNINVSHNQVSDLAPLAGVKGLQVLYATNNKIASVEALAELLELNAISLRSNFLSDVDVLYTLPQLKKLYVQGNSQLDLDIQQLSEGVIVAI